ncbi:hypothetical protein SCUCBS95973_006904 [Sporothrix curviconia]|uniref:Serine carboxypeptidase n=1 Tax=Sporothrix curviconia TaxID=1260050 RepID=A0ABP0C900_9PEZI
MKTSTLWASALCALSGLSSVVSGKKAHMFPKPPGVKALDNPNPNGGIVNATFQQPVDHNDPSKGTFSNRFWFNTQYWKGPGSPVFLFMPGESDASDYLGYLYNSTIPGLYAEVFGGLVVIIEHRYWGESLPFDTLTAETMQYLDLPQAMMDITYFAKNVSFDLGSNLGTSDNSDNAPWVLVGGSYPGALTAWINQKEPGVFYAYHSSSGVVETITDFYTYFEPVEEALPANCSADVRAVVQYVDHVLTNGDEADILELKEGFGLGYLNHNDDFVMQVSTPMRQWQEDEAAVQEFCDYLETTGETHIVLSNPNGVGLATALPLYMSYINKTRGPACAGENYTTCNTYVNEDEFNMPDDFTDMRQWDWLCCHNPFGWWQVGPNVTDGTNIISQYADVHYFARQCPLMFPTVNGYSSGLAAGFTPEHLDLYTGGWNGNFDKVIFVNGEVDPWRSATVSSDYRPGGRLASTQNAPVFVVPAGNHCPELLLEEYEGAPDLYKDIFATMRTWLSEWKAPSKN